jgi:putative ABC transport system permease protein
MILNYLLLALRNLRKQRGYAFVNTLGLAIGLASAMFIFLYVRDELTFDTFHPYSATTYRLGYSIHFPNGDHEAYPASPAGWDNYIKETYGGVGEITSFDLNGMPTSIQYVPADRIVLTEDIIWAESNIGKVLNIPIISGARTDYLKEVNSLILSESAAREIFGNDDPIGKTLTLSHAFSTRGQKIEMMVSAVYRDLPSNTHLRPKYICNILAMKPFIENLETLLSTSMGDGQNNYWTQSMFVLDDPSKLPVIEADLQKRADAIIQRYNLNFTFKPLIRKITDVHFDQAIDWGISHKSADKKYTYVFITIALLILVVACINYVNLATAKSATRAREIGLRKTFGGFRLQLFIQFMAESFVLVMISAILALLLVLIFLPAFNNMTGKTFSFLHLFEPTMLAITFGVILLVTLLAGSYPAIVVSGFQPASVLKGKFSFRKGSTLFRQMLTTVQFIVAVTLLVGTVIVVRQMDLMRFSKLNEAGRQTVSIRYGGFTGVANDQKYLTFKSRVMQDPEIGSMTLANHLPRLDFFGPISMRMQFPDISEEQHEWFQLNGDFDFPKTFNMKIIAGRDFESNNIADSTSILLNESAVRSLNLTPEEVVGKTVVRPAHVMNYGPPDSTAAPITGHVIGVVEDFPYKSAHAKIDPLAISPKPHSFDRIIHVKLPAGKMGEKIALLERTWKEVFPEFGFDYWFIDEEFGRMYENEKQVAELTEKFSALAIFITCVGLYGLASFLSEQRTKEIGIRKTLGASNTQVLTLLLTVFAKLLGIACLIGVPVAWYFSGQWLNSFVYKTPVSFLVLGGSVGLIAVITLVTVGYESLKASMANPVVALKHD